MISNPIFIVGTERSGSNLLRLLLNAHSKIAIPHPPHLMRDLAPIWDLYGDVGDSGNFDRVLSDVLRLLSYHFSPWPVQLGIKTLREAVEERSLYGVYAALYELYLHHTKKARWGCKSTFMCYHIEEILKHHAEPRFIHLVRDPRDVAVSAEKSIFSHYHPYKTSKLWVEQQSEIEKFEDLGSSGKMIRIHYEELTSHTEDCLRLIMTFLDEEFEPSQLMACEGGEARRLASLSESWANCARPVSSSSVGQFRSHLSKKERHWVESAAGKLMSKYGYLPEHDSAPSQPNSIENMIIEALDRWKMLKAELRSMSKDKNFTLRWKKRLYLTYLRNFRTPIAKGQEYEVQSQG